MPRMRLTLLGKMEDNSQRQCGACRLCSKLALHQIDEDVVHGVVTISRPPSYPMEELRDLRPPGKLGGCLWVRGVWGNGRDTRPDQTGVVPWVMRKPSKKGSIMLFVRPDRPTGWRRNATANLIRGAWMQGRHVFIRDGSGRDLCVRS